MYNLLFFLHFNMSGHGTALLNNNIIDTVLLDLQNVLHNNKYSNYFTDKQVFVATPLTNSTALSLSFTAGFLSMFILC